MAISKEDLHQLIDQLDQQDQKAAFDFLEFLVQRSKKKPEAWEKIDKAESDDVPLTADELEQLNSKEGYISGKDIKREFGLQVDLP
jgi:nitric oxide synthase oxygenase domain/subunit